MTFFHFNKTTRPACLMDQARNPSARTMRNAFEIAILNLISTDEKSGNRFGITRDLLVRAVKRILRKEAIGIAYSCLYSAANFEKASIGAPEPEFA
ncbi:MAG: hypothetical protein K5905_00435 [Roseibium sp.]|uniref:hypothetical protein n=1 Tax=Roseibium sp. TaxID=1936156 RepID=UPI0026121EC6|nr:hypothetical protein [Roseibium sp.]MCV0423916.1 hypothetical protein [Roseibium sp.]